MDEADIANDMIMREMNYRIAAVQAKTAKPSPESCERCEDPITLARRALNLRLCIECAKLKERQDRLFTRR
jgi:RNA polymerase-binding transcription factor DksA